jgi:signal transduction histidine kinase
MADLKALKSYVAYYVSRGKSIRSPFQGDLSFQGIVYQHTGYHPQFQQFWESLQQQRDFDELSIVGDRLSFQQLLQQDWDISPCARCDLPIPTPSVAAYDVPSCVLCDEFTEAYVKTQATQTLFGPQAAGCLRQCQPAMTATASSARAAIAPPPSSSASIQAVERLLHIVIFGYIPSNPFMLERGFRRNGFEVQFVTQAEQVTAIAKQQPIDMILVQAELSQAEATRLAHYLHRDPHLQKTPIVVLSRQAGDSIPWSQPTSAIQDLEAYLMTPLAGENLLRQLQTLDVAPTSWDEPDLFWFPCPATPNVSNRPETASTHAPNLEQVLAQQTHTISTLQRNQTQLQQQVQELESLNQLKDDFLSTVSHELRTPMTNIRIAVQMLELAIAQERAACHEPTLEALSVAESKVSHYLQILRDECEREIGLINDLLDLQRLEAKRQPLSPENIDLQDWLHHIIDPFQERAQRRHQILELQYDSALPDSLVSDPPSLARILSELLNNACKYTPPEERIICSVATTTNSGLQFRVCNFGVEIPLEEIPRIFEKFYRVPKTDPWKQGGTGLGLALVKKLAEHLQGQIQVESGAMKTCFTIEIPLHLQSSEAA